MAYNNYHFDNALRLNHQLPSYIVECGLNAKGFSVANGGNFQCPACGNKIGLYWDKNANPERWSINGFGHCSHFGYNGEYPNDVTGIYLALNGTQNTYENLKEARAKFEGLSFSTSISDYEKEKRDSEKLKEERSLKNSKLIAEKGLWDSSFPNEAKNLLLKRGIEYEVLPEEVQKRIGYIKKEKLYYLYESKEGDRYKHPITALLFALGEKKDEHFVNFQGRKIRNNEFETNHKFRFLNVGQSDVFLKENISLLGQEDKTSCLFITEGPFDCLSYYMANAVSVSVQGSGNIESIITKLKEVLPNVGKVTVFIDFDYDDAGTVQAINLIGKIRTINTQALIVRHPGYYSDSKDANDFLIKHKYVFLTQVSIFKEIARQYKEDLITKRVALSWISFMKGKNRKEWQSVINFLKTNALNAEIEEANG